MSEEPREAAPGPAADEAPQRSGAAPLLLWLAGVLAGVLALVVVGVALSPLWAPAIAPLLPWRTPAAGVDLHPIEARIAALEARPAPPKIDLSGIEASEKKLAGRLDRFEQAAIPDHLAAALAGLQRLDGRVATLEAQSAAQQADLGKLHDALAKLDKLGDRVAALEQQLRARAGTERKGAALLVALSQMREAVDRAQPFAAEYDAFRTLAQGAPDLAAAAAPLLAAAHQGVASRAALAERLRRIAGAIATAAAPANPSDWKSQALARVRALVRIRHIGGAGATSPETIVETAETALDHGDLDGAVAALAGLTGAPATAAAAWLQAARDRLAAEHALDRLQQLLAVKLVVPSAPAGAPAKPAPHS
jgi:hypothetical protein